MQEEEEMEFQRTMKKTVALGFLLLLILMANPVHGNDKFSFWPVQDQNHGRLDNLQRIPRSRTRFSHGQYRDNHLEHLDHSTLISYSNKITIRRLLVDRFI